MGMGVGGQVSFPSHTFSVVPFFLFIFLFPPLPLFFFVPFSPIAMVKLAARKADGRNVCAGNSEMDLFIPVTVVTEAQTLCDDKGQKIEPRFALDWPVPRLV